MVEVHLHFVGGHFLYQAVDAVAVGCHHRHEGASLYHLFVELAFYHEDVAVEFHNLVGVVGAECLFSSSLHVEFAAGFKSLDGFFQRGNHAACHTEHNLFGIFGIGLVHKCFLAVGFYSVKVIA